MDTKLFINNDQYIAGMTMKDDSEPECNNMAFHICENPENVLKNRKNLASLLQCDLTNFVCANQTHSANFYKVTSRDKGCGAICLDNAIADTDALYTYENDILLSSFTADCVPVLFYNNKNGMIGAIHSGWQGTVKEISLRLFEHLTHAEASDPKDFHVFLGSALSQEKFEVDFDVYEKFKNLGYADHFMYYNDKTNKYHIDNQKTVKKQLEIIGVPSNQITIDDTCTYQSKNGFSYRENKKDGRHLSFIMKRSLS
jgi:hypothetical protein